MFTHFYHSTIRKLTAAVGSMFNNITLVRYLSDGTEHERLKVPLSYALKEKYFLRNEGDLSFNRPIQIALPRMAFELGDIIYDPTRKFQTTGQIYGDAADPKSVYQPVPYNFYYDLSIRVRTHEDGFQILEQILPYFTPDFTISVNILPTLNIKRDIAIILQSVTTETEAEGDGEEGTRNITITLSFNVQAFLFGPISQEWLIREAIVNIYQGITKNDEYHLTLNRADSYGDFIADEEIYIGDEYQRSKLHGRVLHFSNTGLALTVYQGDGLLPLPGDVVRGFDSSAHFVVNTSSKSPLQLVKIDVTPNPSDVDSANVANQNFTTVTTISEFPYIEE